MPGTELEQNRSRIGDLSQMCLTALWHDHHGHQIPILQRSYSRSIPPLNLWYLRLHPHLHLHFDGTCWEDRPQAFAGAVLGTRRDFSSK